MANGFLFYGSLTGSSFRASWADSDLLLIELDSQPASSVNVFYAGWDARTQTPSKTHVTAHKTRLARNICAPYTCERFKN